MFQRTSGFYQRISARAILINTPARAYHGWSEQRRWYMTLGLFVAHFSAVSMVFKIHDTHGSPSCMPSDSLRTIRTALRCWKVRWCSQGNTYECFTYSPCRRPSSVYPHPCCCRRGWSHFWNITARYVSKCQNVYTSCHCYA